MDVLIYNDISQDNPATIEWENLNDLACDLNPFFRLTWARAWLNSYPEGVMPHIWLVQQESAAMILPLMEYRATLRSLCYNAADFTGSISNRSGKALVSSITNRLRLEARKKEIILWNVLPRDPILKELRRLNAVSEIHRESGCKVNLNRIRSNVHRWINSSKTRKQSHRDLQRLIRDGATLQLCYRPTNEELINFMDLHDRQWRHKGKQGKFRDHRRRRFLLELNSSNFPIQVSKLALNGMLLSYNISFLSSKSVFYWNSGYNVDFASRGSGSALLIGELEHICQQTRFTTFDFLRGNEKYKSHYAHDKYSIFTYRVHP